MPDFSFDLLDATRDADVRLWNRLVDESPSPDIYYRPGYALACREWDTEAVCALVIEASGFRVLVPLLVARSARNGGKPGAHAFACSPYGYGGLLPLNAAGVPDVAQRAALGQALHAFARERDLICLVLRMHPLLHQTDCFVFQDGTEDIIAGLGNPTIALDLRMWNEQERCPSSLKKNRRADLRSARKNLRTSWSCGSQEESGPALRTFQALYNARMRALGARDFYFFSDDYYAALARGLQDRLAIGLAWCGAEPVAGALFMADSRFAHYHLSAGNSKGHALKASTLLISEGAVWARQRGCGQLHLGGGLAGSLGGEDTLFRFKQSFGGDVFPYGTLTVIAEQTSFTALCNRRDTQWPFVPQRARSPISQPGTIDVTLAPKAKNDRNREEKTR